MENGTNYTSKFDDLRAAITSNGPPSSEYNDSSLSDYDIFSSSENTDFSSNDINGFLSRDQNRFSPTENNMFSTFNQNEFSASEHNGFFSNGHNELALHGEEASNNNRHELMDIPDNIPEWKKEVYRRRNNKIMEEVEKIAEAKKDPYDGLPDWKKPIMKKKDEQKAIALEQERIRAENELRFTASPRWQQQLILKKMSSRFLTANKQ